MSELRSWFLRNVLEAVERQLGAPAVTSLQSKLPPRLLAHAALDRLRASAALDTVPLDEGAEILLSVDSLLGDGSGKLLENVGVDLAARVLSQGGSVVRGGDLAGTVARLEAFLEHPFVGVPFAFELRRNPSGFLSERRRDRARASHARAAPTWPSGRSSRLSVSRARSAPTICAFQPNTWLIARTSALATCRWSRRSRLRRSNRPPSRRPVPARPPAVSLSAEVERILRSTVPPRASEPAPLSVSSRSQANRPRPSQPPPPARVPAEGDEQQPPESMTLRVASNLDKAPLTGARGPALK